LHGVTPEQCLRKSAEKYNNKCISSTVKHRGRGVINCAAGIGKPLHCEK